jgi:hypothetical protein
MKPDLWGKQGKRRRNGDFSQVPRKEVFLVRKKIG